jgi:hypothetical protein
MEKDVCFIGSVYENNKYLLIYNAPTFSIKLEAFVL